MHKFLVSIITIIVSVFATVSLWGWFVVPLGVVAISALQAMGLSLLVRGATITKADFVTAVKSRDENDDITEKTAGYVHLVFWGLTWLSGYIIHLCM